LKKTSVLFWFAALGLLLDAGGAAQRGILPDPVTVREADGFFRVFTPESYHTNIGVLAGPEGLLLIDTGHMSRTILQLRKALDSVSSLPVKFILHTHDHADHRAGDALGGEAAILIDRASLQPLAGRGILEGPLGPAEDAAVAFGPFYRLRFGGQEVRIFPAGGIHSDQDILIQIPEKRILQTGDLFLSQCFPATSDVDGYMAFLDRTLASFPDVDLFVPGHGRSVDRAGLQAYRDMLARLRDKARAGKAAGRSLDDLLRPEVLDEFRSWHTLLDWLGPESWAKSAYGRR
jgi:cyclase